MVSGESPYSQWMPKTYAELSGMTYDQLTNGINVSTLSASIALAPIIGNPFQANHIMTAELSAYTNQFAYLYDKTYEMGLLRRIEFSVGADLDNIWGKIYQVKRYYEEIDDDYRKRLQIYLKQLVGSGTKPAIEDIVSIIVEWPDSCRVDTYAPGFCRIYLKDHRGYAKCLARLDLINKVLPDTLAAGVNYRFYIPYHPLEATIVLHGPVRFPLLADEALQDVVKYTLHASIYLAKLSYHSLDADIVLSAFRSNNLKAYMALKEIVASDLEATEALSSSVNSSLDADISIISKSGLTLKAYERLQAENDSVLNASVALRDQRLRPVMARMKLEEAT